MPKRTPMPSLMLLDGDRKVTLSIVRNLGQMGIPIAVGGDNPHAKACYSRYAGHRFIYPRIQTELFQAHHAIIEQVRAWRPDILMPVSSPGWSCVYAFYDEYAELTSLVPCPGRAYFESLSNKNFLAQYAEECGVPTPQTFRPRSYQEALALRDRLPYPVLLKPRAGTCGSGIRRAENTEEFEALLRSFSDVPMIQEYIDGDDLELTILALYGEPLAGHGYASLRKHPLLYGQPIACRSVHDNALMQTGTQFLKKLRYHGIAHMDFKRDKRDGCARLIDFQASLPSTNEISTRCGVNFPLLLYKLALGEKPDPCFPQQDEVEFRWLGGELRYLARTQDKLHAARNLLQWHNVATDFSLFDPRPDAVGVVSKLLSRR